MYMSFGCRCSSLPMQQLADAAALYFQPNAAAAGRPNGGAAAAW
jgi:hypothetical protein